MVIISMNWKVLESFEGTSESFMRCVRILNRDGEIT